MADGGIGRVRKVFSRIGEEVIPWEECGRLVRECNPCNRHMAPSTVRIYRADLRADRWPVTHEGVAFGPMDGMPKVVIDGQHRLEAHYQEKRDYIGVVAHYATEEDARRAIQFINIGRGRAAHDVLVIAGVMEREGSKRTKSVSTMLHALMFGNKDKTSIDQIGAFYVANRAAIDWACRIDIRGAMLPASLALAWLDAPADVERFAEQVSSGVGTPGSPAALWNKALPTALTTPGGGGSERVAVCLRALRIIKAEVAREPTPSKLYTTTDALGWFLARLRRKGVLVSLMEERSGPEAGSDG